MVVYRVVNKLTGLVYIGITRHSFERRQREHRCDARKGRGNRLHAAIRLYGWDAFRWDVLQRCDTTEELMLAERAQITAHASNVLGYNSTHGGYATAPCSKETRAKLSRSGRESTLRRFGLKRQSKLFHPHAGRVLTEAHRQKISASLLAADHSARPRKLLPADEPEIDRRRAAGESYRAIGDAFGVRAETVFYNVKNRSTRAS